MHFEQMADVVENEAKMAYRRPAAAAMDEQRGPSKGFVVREAPWTTANKKVGIYTRGGLTFLFKLSHLCVLIASQCLGSRYEQL